VEDGTLVFIGATTENPSFELNNALLSRARVYVLRALSDTQLEVLLQRALTSEAIAAAPEVLTQLARAADGDARRALNALEVGVLTTPPDKDGKIHFDVKVAEESAQKRIVYYDKDEDYHYDTASAFIKSMRGSDPDAAVYWLAKMLYAGEDPRFIARRIVILASEDIGNADPQALVVAASALQAIEFVGMPEARIILAQAVTYMATASKSNAAYLAIEAATEDVKNESSQEVPDHLRDKSYPGAEKLGHGEGYKYPHQFADHYVKQNYVPKSKIYYRPTEAGYEKNISERMKKLKDHS
jgi:putative ATPase